MNFKRKAIFCIAFAILRFPLIAHAYSLTTIIKDANNGKPLDEATWQVLNLRPELSMNLYKLARLLHNYSAFFKDGSKLQGAASSDSSGQCQIIGIDENAKYGRLRVTHEGYIEYNSDGVQGRSPPTQIELSPRFNIVFEMCLCLLPVSSGEGLT